MVMARVSVSELEGKRRRVSVVLGLGLDNPNPTRYQSSPFNAFFGGKGRLLIGSLCLISD
jgi:hypothetical protein